MADRGGGPGSVTPPVASGTNRRVRRIAVASACGEDHAPKPAPRSSPWLRARPAQGGPERRGDDVGRPSRVRHPAQPHPGPERGGPDLFAAPGWCGSHSWAWNTPGVLLLARETPSARAAAKPRLIESLRTLLETKMRRPRNYWKSLAFSAFLQREVLPSGPGVVTTQSGGGYHLSRRC